MFSEEQQLIQSEIKKLGFSNLLGLRAFIAECNSIELSGLIQKVAQLPAGSQAQKILLGQISEIRHLQNNYQIGGHPLIGTDLSRES